MASGGSVRDDISRGDRSSKIFERSEVDDRTLQLARKSSTTAERLPTSSFNFLPNFFWQNISSFLLGGKKMGSKVSRPREMTLSPITSGCLTLVIKEGIEKPIGQLWYDVVSLERNIERRVLMLAVLFGHWFSPLKNATRSLKDRDKTRSTKN